MKRFARRTATCVVGCAMAVTAIGCRGITDPAANEILMTKLGHTSFTVFPAFVRRGSKVRCDRKACETLAEFIREEKLGTAAVSEALVPIGGPWRMNQARMLRESAESFAAFLEKSPIDTDYALLPEYLGGPHEIGGIHAYLLDAEGRVAYAVLLNSHWPAFSDAAPKNAADCTDVLMTVFRGDLRPANESD